MEQVVELFGRFRSREIGLKELTGTLRNFLLHHPQAPKQGLGWLDLAQQRYPLPVTDFIQLRADMDYLLRSLALQSPAADADTTRIGMTAPHARHDDTLLPSVAVPPPLSGRDDGLATRIAAPADDGLSTRIAAPADEGMATCIAPPNADDELATVIAGVQTAAAALGNDATVVNAALSDDGATVIANPAMPRDIAINEATVLAPPLPLADATVIAPTLPQAGTEATRVAAPQAPGRDVPKMPHSQRVPPRTVTVAPPAPPARSSTPVMAVIGGIALALLVAGGFAGWRHTQTPAVAPITPEKVATTPRLETVLPAEAQTAADAIDDASASENTITLKLEIDNATAVMQASPATPTGSNTQASASVQPISTKEPVEPLPNDVDGLLLTVKSRIEKGRLLPAEDQNSATFAIKALIAKAPESNAVSEARKQLSQAHLELAKQARERGDLEAAQTHLDNAFDVRLMK